jgi:hypothetical protein
MNRRLNACRSLSFAMLALLCVATSAQAQVRAWLDRTRIASGETTTLNIAAPDLDAAPDYTPLQPDFEVSQRSSARSAQIVNGRVTMHTQYAVVLQPRRDGVITIPSLRVGGNRTSPPLTLTVTPASSVPARAGDVAFIDAQLDDAHPYVQQAVGLKLRLFYAVPLVSGQLDQPEPQGATLRKVGQDLQYSQEMAGRRYSVVERRYLLIGERSGRVLLPGARFRGQGVGGFFDDLFGDGRRPLAADSPSRVLDIRPIPANAPQPWLPLNDLRLRYTTTPGRARAGEATTVTVEAVADGAVASQLPELVLDAGGAQVFPEPLQSDETFEDGRPRTTMTRKFSIVPARAGALRVDAPRIEWWDVRGAVPRTATLPPIALSVAPGAAGATTATDTTTADSATTASQGDDGRIRIPGIQGRILPWAAATAMFALLWFATLLWGLHRKPVPVAAPEASSPPPAPHTDLRRALADGDLGTIADALRATATPPVHDLDALRERLADPVQRDAIDQLQRARWAGGDPGRARTAVRAAFARGIRWRTETPVSRADPLPPLYPPA